MCIFVVLCVDETYYHMREYSDVIKLPESYPPPVVGGGYRLSNFWLAKEVNKEVIKTMQHRCL
jgi:hypothetical protein